MHFCNQRTPHGDPELQLNGNAVQLVQETKFLGLIFDHKLSFIPHIKALKTKCLKALDLLKVLCSTEWGADSEKLLHLYRSLVRSKLDYGSIVYGSARKSYIKMLDTVHHQGLRLATGAFRTSPVQSLYVACKEPSLEKRRLKLALQYVVKLGTNKTNPAYGCVFNSRDQELYEKKPGYIKPLRFRIKDTLEELNVDLNTLVQSHFSEIPPWELAKPQVNLELSKTKKSDTHPISYQEQFDNIRDEHPSHIAIYTDGSKEDNKVAAAAVSRLGVSSRRIAGHSSIFTAEAHAIMMALAKMEDSEEKDFFVFSDSKSCLQALAHLKTDHPIVVQILDKLNALKEENYDIHLCWVPGHVGLRGNELADRTAKKALSGDVEPCPIPHTDVRPKIKRLVTKKWQEEWDEYPTNKLHHICPSVSETIQATPEKRKDQVVLTRCKIGHTRLTHAFLMQGEDAPECIPCQCPLTVKHILLESIGFRDQ